MGKHAFYLLFGFLIIAAGIVFASGCFSSPTSPSLLTSGGAASGGTGGTGGTGGAVATPTPVFTVGTVHGTIVNATGTVTIYGIFGTGTSGLANGPFTITNVLDGTYQVFGMDASFRTSNTVTVTILHGNIVTGVTLTF